MATLLVAALKQPQNSFKFQKKSLVTFFIKLPCCESSLTHSDFIKLLVYAIVLIIIVALWYTALIFPTGKTYQDWRGVILSETNQPYSLLSNEKHQERLMSITKRQRDRQVGRNDIFSRYQCGQRQEIILEVNNWLMEHNLSQQSESVNLMFYFKSYNSRYLGECS